MLNIIAKTYACKKATINSNITIIPKTIDKPKKMKNTKSNLVSKKVFTFIIILNKMCNKEWPATMLEKRRIDKLKIRIKYEKNSKQNRKGIKKDGTPFGI